MDFKMPGMYTYATDVCSEFNAPGFICTYARSEVIMLIILCIILFRISCKFPYIMLQILCIILNIFLKIIIKTL